MGQGSSRTVFEFHSAAGNARARSQKADRDRKRSVPRPNPRLAGTALPRGCRQHAQMVASVNDQYAHGGFISSAVPRAAGLLLLVRTNPTEPAVHLPADASAKNG